MASWLVALGCAQACETQELLLVTDRGDVGSMTLCCILTNFQSYNILCVLSTMFCIQLTVGCNIQMYMYMSNTATAVQYCHGQSWDIPDMQLTFIDVSITHMYTASALALA